MGKQVKNWTPPVEDEIISETSEWTPPDTDEIIDTEPVKKKESASPSSSASAVLGKPSATASAKLGEVRNPSTERPTATQRLQDRVANYLKSSQAAFNEEAEAKRKELQSRVDADPTQVDAANAEFQKFVADREGQYNSDLDKWMGIYTEQFEKEDFEENKETNPVKTFAKTAWTTFSKDLPSQAYGARALVFSGLKKFDDAVITGAQDILEKVGIIDPEDRRKPDQSAESRLILKDIQSSIELSKASEEDKKYLINNLDRVKGDDFVDIMNYAASAVGQGVAQIPVSAGTKGASSLVQQMGSIYIDSVQKIAKEQGISVEEVIKQGKDDVVYPLIFGVGSGLLDAIGAKSVVGALSKDKVMKGFRDRALEITKAAGKGAGTEAATEAVQTGLEQIGVGKAQGKSWYDTLKGFNWDQITESALQGGIAGLFLSGGGKTLSTTFDAIKPTAKVETTQAQQPIVRDTKTSASGERSELDAEIQQDEIIDDNATTVQGTDERTELTGTQEEAATAIESVPDGTSEQTSDTTGSERIVETPQRKADRELNELVDRGAISREGNKVTILTEEGGREVKRIYDELQKSKSSDQPSVTEKKYEVKPVELSKKGKNFDYNPSKNLTDRERKVEDKFASDLDDNFSEREKQYQEKFGNVLDADNVRSLSEDFNDDPVSNSNAVHSPASSFLFKLYQNRLSELAPAGKKNKVVFIGGGSGAGKSSIDFSTDDAQIVYNTSMAPTQVAKNQINRALNSGKEVEVNYVYRDPVSSFENGVIPRAIETGRVVPITEIVRSHVGSQETMGILEKEYTNEPKFRLNVFDNTGKKGEQKKSSLDNLPQKKDAKQLTEELNGIADNLYKDGRITKSLYDQLKGNSSGNNDGGGTDINNNPDSPSRRTYAIAKRIFASDANEAIKRGVKERGANYIPKSINVTDSEAKSLIELYGNDRAESLVRDPSNGITGDTRTALAARLYESYKQAADQSIDPETKRINYEKAIDIALTSADQLKEAGRQANAAKIWKQITKTPDMTVLAMEKANQKQAEQLLAPIAQQIPTVKQEIDEEIRKIIERRVQEGVEQRLKRAKLITTEQRKKIADAFDALKVKDVKGSANDITRVLGATVWNGSLEAVKKAVLLGADVANAVQAGIDYIKDNYKGDWSEEDYRAAITSTVESMIPKEKVNPGEIDEKQIKTPKLSGKKKKQFIDEVVEAYNEGKLTDKRFEQLYAKQLGAREFSPEERQIIRDLATTISELEQFEDVVKNDFTRENIAKYKNLLDKAQKANTELQQFAQKPSNVWDTMISIMQGNLLTPLSLVTNVYSNAALQPLRFLSTSIGSVIDYGISQISRAGLLNQQYKDKSIDLSELQKGYFQGAWNGILEGGKQLIDGPKSDERNLREINTQFSPVRAVSRWADGNRSASQKVNDYIEGTIGWPAEVMFRLLNLGDKPYRRAAETARAMEIAKQKGLKGTELKKFLMFPDAESANLIKEAGDDATFQQENASAKFVQNMLSKLINFIGETKYVGGPLKVLAKSQIPFVKTPWNIMVETLTYAAFPVTFGVGVRQIYNGNKRSGSILIGKAIVGAMIFALAKELFKAGIMSWDEPYDKEAGKQRERRQIQYDNVPPNSLNVSAIQRGLIGDGFDIQDGDTWVNYEKMGVMGLLFDNYANNYFANIREDQQMPEQSELWVDMFTTAPRVLSQSLDQSFLKGTSSLLTAIQSGGGYESEKWLIDTSGAIASIVYPNTLSTISKSSDEFTRDTRDEKFVDQLRNTYRTKFFLGDQLPAKVNLWGEKVTGQPEGRDKFVYYLFDPTKFKEVDTDNFKYKLYQAWKESKFDDDYLPSIPKREISYRGVKIKLNSQQYEKLATYIGEQRKNLASSYINSAGFERKNKEKVLEKLKDLYKEGADRGKKKFLMDMGWNILTPQKLSKINKTD